MDNNEIIFSVKELSNILKACFERKEFTNLSVMGEIYSIKLGSKFSYIDLGDTDSDQSNGPVLKIAFQMFSSNFYILNKLSKGDVVKVRGKLSYYPHGCSLTLWANHVETVLDTLGKNLLKKRKILENLDKLGYLNPERKKPIPEYVTKIGIVTANNSAAYSDILESLKTRFPVSTILYPCQVQGDNAAKTMIKSIKMANDDKVDVIFLGRGGGSNTDLSAFDDEELAICIATSKIPVITCIGHSIDESIADRVADKSFITPTDAGKSINVSKEDIKKDISSYKDELNNRIVNIIHNYELILQDYKNKLDSSSLPSKLKVAKTNIEKYKNLLNNYFINDVKQNKMNIQTFANRLNYLHQNNINFYKDLIYSYKLKIEKYNDDSILNRGYIKVFKNDKMIKSATDLSKNDEIKLSFADGSKKAVIK